MPRDHRTSKEDFPLAEARRLRAAGHSIQAIADAIGWSFAQTRRKLLASSDVPSNGDVPITTLQRVELVGEPVTPETGAEARSTAQTSNDLADLAARIASLEAHRLEVDAQLATLQTQPQDTARPRAAVRRAPMRSLAQDYAEPTQTWDNPEDAKSVPFNLSLPRGLKHLLDAEAKRTGFPASRLVQRLLMAALVGERARDA